MWWLESGPLEILVLTSHRTFSELRNGFRTTSAASTALGCCACDCVLYLCQGSGHKEGVWLGLRKDYTRSLRSLTLRQHHWILPLTNLASSCSGLWPEISLNGAFCLLDIQRLLDETEKREKVGVKEFVS